MLSLILKGQSGFQYYLDRTCVCEGDTCTSQRKPESCTGMHSKGCTGLSSAKIEADGHFLLELRVTWFKYRHKSWIRTQIFQAELTDLTVYSFFQSITHGTQYKVYSKLLNSCGPCWYYCMITSFSGLMLLILILSKAKKLILTSSELTVFDLTCAPCCRVGTTVTFEGWVRCLSKLMKMNKK